MLSGEGIEAEGSGAVAVGSGAGGGGTETRACFGCPQPLRNRIAIKTISSMEIVTNRF